MQNPNVSYYDWGGVPTAYYNAGVSYLSPQVPRLAEGPNPYSTTGRTKYARTYSLDQNYWNCPVSSAYGVPSFPEYSTNQDFAHQQFSSNQNHRSSQLPLSLANLWPPSQQGSVSFHEKANETKFRQHENNPSKSHGSRSALNDGKNSLVGESEDEAGGGGLYHSKSNHAQFEANSAVAWHRRSLPPRITKESPWVRGGMAMNSPLHQLPPMETPANFRTSQWALSLPQHPSPAHGSQGPVEFDPSIGGMGGHPGGDSGSAMGAGGSHLPPGSIHPTLVQMQPLSPGNIQSYHHQPQPHSLMGLSVQSPPVNDNNTLAYGTVTSLSGPSSGSDPAGLRNRRIRLWIMLCIVVIMTAVLIAMGVAVYSQVKTHKRSVRKYFRQYNSKFLVLDGAYINLDPELLDNESETFRRISKYLEAKIDKVMNLSPFSKVYEGSEVTRYRIITAIPGLEVQFHIRTSVHSEIETDQLLDLFSSAIKQNVQGIFDDIHIDPLSLNIEDRTVPPPRL